MTGPRAGAAPAIDGDLCSLGRLAQAGCAACAAACPRGALRAEPEGLLLDAAACSGCGGCVAACPQQAVTLPGFGAPGMASAGPGTGRGRQGAARGGAAPADRAGRGVAALVCPRRAGAGAGSLCLQALGLEVLARLWLGGLRRLVTVTGDCAACPDGRGLALEDRVLVLNALLADRGLAPLHIGPAPDLADFPPHLPRLEWPRDAAPDAAGQGRRAFLGLGRRPAPDPAPNPAPNPALARLQAIAPGPDVPGTPPRHAPPRHAFVPRIDAAKCSGCDACRRICPAEVIGLHQDQETGQAAYRVAPAGCSGCGLCMDVCGASAIVLERLAPVPADVALVPLRCRGCGVDRPVPAAGPLPAGGLCAVCARSGHHRRLFQVLP